MEFNYCFTCTPANTSYCEHDFHTRSYDIDRTGRILSDQFREHIRDVEQNGKDASKTVAWHLNIPNNSYQQTAVCFSLHHGNRESRLQNVYNKNLSSKSALSYSTRNQKTLFKRNNELFLAKISKTKINWKCRVHEA